MSEQIDTALRWAREQFAGCSESPRLDAELLLAFCLEKPRVYLYTWPEYRLNEECWQHFRTLVEQRLQPMPVAYLVGEREFYSRCFRTSPVALVPRPETEATVDLALESLPVTAACSVLDLGTGSGIIAVTIKAERPAAEVYATDVDPACIELAQVNAALHEVEIRFIVSDWYAALASDRRFDLIVSNPPYVAADHPFLAAGDLPAEPQHALSPGDSGLEALESIIAGASSRLQPGGRMVVEHGYDQQAPVRALFERNGFDQIHCAMDLNELPRATRARLS